MKTRHELVIPWCLLLFRCSYVAAQTTSGNSDASPCNHRDGWVTSQDDCLLFGVVRKNWTEARVTCKNRSSDLASFPDNVHYATLSERLTSTPSSLWVGYRHTETDPGWLNGSPESKTTRFRAGNKGENILCGTVKQTSNGTHRFLQWNLEDCALPNLFVCMLPRHTRRFTKRRQQDSIVPFAGAHQANEERMRVRRSRHRHRSYPQVHNVASDSSCCWHWLPAGMLVPSSNGACRHHMWDAIAERKLCTSRSPNAGELGQSTTAPHIGDKLFVLASLLDATPSVAVGDLKPTTVISSTVQRIKRPASAVATSAFPSSAFATSVSAVPVLTDGTSVTPTTSEVTYTQRRISSSGRPSTMTTMKTTTVDVTKKATKKTSTILYRTTPISTGPTVFSSPGSNHQSHLNETTISQPSASSTSSSMTSVKVTSQTNGEFYVDSTFTDVIQFMTSSVCNRSTDCLSYVLLHPHLTANVKVELLNSNLVACPIGVLIPNNNMTSDKSRHSIQHFFWILNRYLDHTSSIRENRFNNTLDQVLLTVESFLDSAMEDWHQNPTLMGRFSHLEFQIAQVPSTEMMGFEYHDRDNTCTVTHLGFAQENPRDTLGQVNVVTVVMKVPQRKVSVAPGSELDDVLASPVLLLSGFVEGQRRSLQHSFSLRHRGELVQSNRSHGPSCAFLESSSLKWSSHGCYTEEPPPTDHETNDTDDTAITATDVVRCRCNHTSNFAVLMQIAAFEISEANRVALSIITYIGCSITVITQFMAITVFSCIGSLNCERVCVHRNLCVAIVGAQVTFLAGIDAVGNRMICALVAVLLQYWYTAVFIWMLVEGLHLYSKVVRVFGTERSRINYYICFGWGLPLVLVVLSAAADWEGYGTKTSCWLSIERNTIWSFVGPALAIIIVNLVILATVVKIVTASARQDKNGDLDPIRAGVKAAFLLLPLLGLTWLFGLAAVNKDLIVFQYLFALFNTLQGFFIFLFHCVFNTEVRQAVRRLQERRSLQKGDLSSSAGFSSSPSVSPTPTVLDNKKGLSGGESPFDLTAPCKVNRVVPARYQATTNIAGATAVQSASRGTARGQNITRRKTEETALMYI